MYLAHTSILHQVCYQDEGKPVPFDHDTHARECGRFEILSENPHFSEMLLFTVSRNTCPCSAETAPVVCSIHSGPVECTTEPFETIIDLPVCGSVDAGIGMLAYQQYCASSVDCVKKDTEEAWAPFHSALQEFSDTIGEYGKDFTKETPVSIIAKAITAYEMLEKSLELTMEPIASLQGCATYVAKGCCEENVRIEGEAFSANGMFYTKSPTSQPSSIPSDLPSLVPSEAPTASPSKSPSLLPSTTPSTWPSDFPSRVPSVLPSQTPSVLPSENPSTLPSVHPSATPSSAPSGCLVLEDTIKESSKYYMLDFSGDGQSAGDVIAFESNILINQETEEIGVSSGRCVVLPTHSLQNTSYCIATLVFPEGILTLQGIKTVSQITAGSDCFRGLNGLVHYNTSTEGNIYELGFIDGPEKECIQDSYESPWTEQGNDVYIDWDKNGPSPGDVMVFANKEITTTDGKKGFLDGECMVLKDPDSARPFCTVTFAFPGAVEDRLTAMGVLDAMVVTGGTGCFFGLSGLISGFFSTSNDLKYNATLDTLKSSVDTSCTPGIFDITWSEQFGDYFIDYGRNRLSPGDGFVFADNLVQIPIASGTLEAKSSGRCIVLQGLVRTYCTTSISLPEGTIAVAGFFDEMSIMGGTGCFRGLRGFMRGSSTATGFQYDFTIY